MLKRASEILDNAISEVASAGHPDSQRLTTAVRDSNGNLKVSVWDIDPENQIHLRGSSVAEAISSVAATRPGLGRAVTAVRSAGGNLKLTSWDITVFGLIHRRGDAAAGAASMIAVESLSEQRVITALRDGANKLKLIVWDIDSSGNFQRKGDASAEVVNAVAITRLGPNRVVTAVQTTSGKLKVIVWDVSANGTITRKSEASAGRVTRVGIVSEETVLTVIRDNVGNLKGILWDVNPDTGEIVRSADRVAHTVNNIATDGSFMMAVRDSDSKLQLCSWQRSDFTFIPDGEIILSHGDAGSGGTITKLAISSVNTIDNGSERIFRWATSVRTQSGKLKIIVWTRSVAIPL